MLYVVNEDAPGFIGRIGSLLGENGINIGTFHLGRREAGGEAVLLLSVDQPIPQDVIEQGLRHARREDREGAVVLGRPCAGRGGAASALPRPACQHTRASR